jgi:aminoglycoside 2''-phosphotransferase
MPENLAEILRRRAQAIMPGLAIEQFEISPEGLDNDVAIVNQQWVFRFPKTKQYARILEAELRILDLIRPRVDLDIPVPVYRSANSVVYSLLGGQPLSRRIVLGLDASTQSELAEQLGTFLYKLHTTDISDLKGEIPSTPAPVNHEKWLDIRQRVTENVYPLLLNYQIQWAHELFDSVLEKPDAFDYEPALIHGDLAPYHILFDDQSRRIMGVIDFGMAGIGDAALDIGSLISTYGESFVSKMRNSYPGLESYLPRGRFYAQAIELQWVLLGIETGEPFWFTAHLGGARDMQV